MDDLIYRQAAIDAVMRLSQCWIPPETDRSAKHLNDLIFDINTTEICSQIKSDNLRAWCGIIQTEMKMAMVQLPCWAGMEGTK